MTVSELLTKRSAVQTQIDGILAKEALSAEDRESVKTLEAEFDQLSADVTAAENLAKEDQELRQRNKQRSESLNQGRGRKTDALAATASKTVLGNARESIEDDPNKGFKTPREFMLSVINAGRGVELDNRLKHLAAGSDEARGNSDPAGGFLVPEGFSPNLLQISPEADPMAGMTTNIPMSTSIVKIPARVDTTHTTSVSGGLTVTRRPETIAGTSSQVTLSQVVLEAHSLFGLSYATEEILTDSPISFAALLTAGFNDQFTGHLVNERINGTGIGEFMGVLNAPCLVSVSKETGQAATTFVYENAVNMRSRCWGYSKAIWIANHDTMPQLMLMNQAVGTGGAPVWQPSAREDHPDLLFGRPLIFSEFAKTLGTVGDVILANWSEYLEGTYEPLQSAESIHVRFVNHERTFKFWLRNAGQPWWKAALTPKNSTNTLSPFVVCATRA
jgi:HK97 family phage major capsid protein